MGSPPAAGSARAVGGLAFPRLPAAPAVLVGAVVLDQREGRSRPVSISGSALRVQSAQVQWTPDMDTDQEPVTLAVVTGAVIPQARQEHRLATGEAVPLTLMNDPQGIVDSLSSVRRDDYADINIHHSGRYIDDMCAT
jgi:hypothetical protein